MTYSLNVLDLLNNLDDDSKTAFMAGENGTVVRVKPLNTT